MASESVTFREAAKLIRLGVNPEDVGDMPYIGLEHIEEGTLRLIRTANAKSVTSTKFRFSKGDILFGKLRPYFRKVIRPNFNGVCSTDIWVVRSREGIDQGYLYYWMASNDFVNFATQGSEGTKMPRAKWDHVGRFQRKRLIGAEQRAISHILGSLDDKIELNRQMNQTLEAKAQAIFKSWFVDFDPVRAKAEGGDPGLPEDIAALFPDSFEDSELGEIPKGWDVKVLGEIATTALGGQWGEEKPGKGLVPAICLRGCDMEDLRNEGYAPKAPVRFIKENAIEKRLPRENDLLIAASGAGPCGRPLWCSPLIKQIYNEPVIYSNFVKRFSTPAPEYAVFLDRLFHEKFIDKSVQDFITGTSVPNLDSKGLTAGFRIVIPPIQILKVFYKQNQSIFEKLYSVENVVLSNLRDTLLSKLISGELRVPDAEKFVEEAGI